MKSQKQLKASMKNLKSWEDKQRSFWLLIGAGIVLLFWIISVIIK
jgi:hypothetical protein